MHGLALNVNPDLKAFTSIVPCGITESSLGKPLVLCCEMVRFEHLSHPSCTGVSSLEKHVPDVQIDEVRTVLLQEFAADFNITYNEVGLDEAKETLHTFA